MKNKLFIGVALIIKDDKTLIVETCFTRAKDKEEAHESAKGFFADFITKHNIESKEILTFVQEKDLRAVRKMVVDRLSPFEAVPVPNIAEFYRREMRAVLDEKFPDNEKPIAGQTPPDEFIH